MPVEDVLRGTMDEVSSLRLLYRSHGPRSERESDWATLFTEPLLGGRVVDPEDARPRQGSHTAVG